MKKKKKRKGLEERKSKAQCRRQNFVGIKKM